ncbi:unnamed protein product [Orchesella dallaii]|uniref:Uncharacterized protein n=1 Tax=Orchesella dallaii TaxID=48710 RepID=A0ABP1QBU3_9HEXA
MATGTRRRGITGTSNFYMEIQASDNARTRNQKLALEHELPLHLYYGNAINDHFYNSSSGDYPHNGSNGDYFHNSSNGDYFYNSSNGDYFHNSTNGNYFHNRSYGEYYGPQGCIYSVEGNGSNSYHVDSYSEDDTSDNTSHEDSYSDYDDNLDRSLTDDSYSSDDDTSEYNHNTGSYHDNDMSYDSYDEDSYSSDDQASYHSEPDDSYYNSYGNSCSVYHLNDGHSYLSGRKRKAPCNDYSPIRNLPKKHKLDIYTESILYDRDNKLAWVNFDTLPEDQYEHILWDDFDIKEEMLLGTKLDEFINSCTIARIQHLEKLLERAIVYRDDDFAVMSQSRQIAYTPPRSMLPNNTSDAVITIGLDVDCTTHSTHATKEQSSNFNSEKTGQWVPPKSFINAPKSSSKVLIDKLEMLQNIAAPLYMSMYLILPIIISLVAKDLCQYGVQGSSEWFRASNVYVPYDNG